MLTGDRPAPEAGDMDNGDSGPAAEWRPRAPRAVTTLLVGRVVQDDGVDDLCRVRNLSAGGMMLETQRGLRVGHEITLELRSGGVLSGRVVWTKPGRAGIQFPLEVEVERVLSASLRHPATPGGPTPRAPRFETCCTAWLRVARTPLRVKLLNLSQGGAGLALPDEQLLGSGGVTLSIPGLTPRRCTVRWQEGLEAGLGFFDFLTFAELSDWLADDARRFSAR